MASQSLYNNRAPACADTESSIGVVGASKFIARRPYPYAKANGENMGTRP
jgi:hypothetical protein